MRKDMAQLLVEHPRHNSGEVYREHRRRANRDPEQAPTKQGMRRPYRARKEFGEYFPPVQGYLRKQVGRPWDKVFSELNSSLHGGGTVIEHVKNHVLNDFVTLKPDWVHGVAHYPSHRFGGGGPIERRFSGGFYVDRYGILRQAPPRSRKRYKSNPIGLLIDDATAYYKLDGVWYRIWLKSLPLPGPDAQAQYDLVLKCWVRCRHVGPTIFRPAAWQWEIDEFPIWRLEETHGSRRVAYRREQVGNRVIRRERLNEQLAALSR